MSQKVNIAILDLYEGQENQGMRCVHEIINNWSAFKQIEAKTTVFEVRIEQQIPSIYDFDVFISTGGPGSPIDSEGSDWENKYFEFIAQVVAHNQNPENSKKHILFICHSFQMACRFFEIGKVCKRKSTSFGVFPVHKYKNGLFEPVFEELADPFYVVDSRDYQVIEPNHKKIREIGASILAIEKERPHIALERAIMAVRFNEYMIGTQFHPEADAVGMRQYLLREDKKATVIANHSEEKWQSMVDQLLDEDKIVYTHNTLIPNFLNIAFKELEVNAWV